MDDGASDRVEELEQELRHTCEQAQSMQESHDRMREAAFEHSTVVQRHERDKNLLEERLRGKNAQIEQMQEAFTLQLRNAKSEAEARAGGSVQAGPDNEDMERQLQSVQTDLKQVRSEEEQARAQLADALQANEKMQKRVAEAEAAHAMAED